MELPHLELCIRKFSKLLNVSGKQRLLLQVSARLFSSLQKSIKSNQDFGLWNLIAKSLNQTAFFSRPKKNKESAEVKNFNHSYYQGLLLTMGNLRGTIIGKNGSGKSSVMDLMYMAINNYAFLYINGFDNVIELKQNEEVKYQLRLGVSSNYSDSQRINIAEDLFYSIVSNYSLQSFKSCDVTFDNFDFSHIGADRT